MTKPLEGVELTQIVQPQFPKIPVTADVLCLWVETDGIREISEFLRDDPGLMFNYLNSISAVDFVEYFDVVYHLTSFNYNHSAIMKTRVFGRVELSVPSVVDIWPGANFQEREIWDLMGISFEGHPNLKRLMLWEGFPGHPLRKDFQDIVRF